MFMFRQRAVPLKTTDGGKSWTELSSLAKLYAYGATFDASLSWYVTLRWRNCISCQEPASPPLA